MLIPMFRALEYRDFQDSPKKCVDSAISTLEETIFKNPRPKTGNVERFVRGDARVALSRTICSRLNFFGRYCDMYYYSNCRNSADLDVRTRENDPLRSSLTLHSKFWHRRASLSRRGPTTNGIVPKI